MQAFVPCREFQVVQVDFERIEFRFVPNGGPIDLEGLQGYAREHLHPSVEISVVAVDQVERGPGGKLDPFISQVVADDNSRPGFDPPGR
jgi:hypothetical protein